MRSIRYRLLASALFLHLLPMPDPAAAGEAPFIAGLSPAQRPADAPRLGLPAQLDTNRALHGISAPLPAGLKFLDDQGGWYTPFIGPGMPGPYDVRGWHATPPSSRQNSK